VGIEGLEGFWGQVGGSCASGEGVYSFGDLGWACGGSLGVKMVILGAVDVEAVACEVWSMAWQVQSRVHYPYVCEILLFENDQWDVY
jgi:hypothetical protein